MTFRSTEKTQITAKSSESSDFFLYNIDISVQTHHDIVPLHLRFLTGQFLTLQLETAM